MASLRSATKHIQLVVYNLCPMFFKKVLYLELWYYRKHVKDMQWLTIKSYKNFASNSRLIIVINHIAIS